MCSFLLKLAWDWYKVGIIVKGRRLGLQKSIFIQLKNTKI